MKENPYATIIAMRDPTMQEHSYASILDFHVDPDLSDEVFEVYWVCLF